MDNLFELERYKPNRVGAWTGASFRRTDRIRDVVPEVCARGVFTIPARWEYDMHENALIALSLWERVCHWVGRLRGIHAKVLNGLVRGSRARCGSIGRAGDHAEARGELLNVGFGTTMIVPGAPL